MRVEKQNKKEKLLNEVDNQIDYVKKDPVAIAFVQAYANVLQEQKKLKDQLKQKNLSQEEKMKLQITKKPIKDNGIHLGEIVIHNILGEGIVVGFSSITSNPMVFFYNEKRTICVHWKELLI